MSWSVSVRSVGSLALTLALGAAARASADGSASSPTCPDAGMIARSQQDLERYDDAVFCLLDRERQTQGVPAFNRSSQLNQSASFQSADMVAYHYFEHDHPGRPSLLNRILWTGYFEGATTGLYAENLANGPQQTTTPTVLVAAWMDSPDHRSNILDPRLHDVGLGASLAPPDAAFYPDRPAIVITSDFGMRVYGGRCSAPPPSSTSTGGSAAPEQRVCTGRRRAHRRRRGHRSRAHRSRR
jgi:uncharacterized protein YkwD